MTTLPPNNILEKSTISFLGQPVEAPIYIPPATAWLRHAPFAHWIVCAAKPRRLVELGTHYGFSYFAFCQAVSVAGLTTECFAVDTWQGDEHAGKYGSEVFDRVSLENARYSDFSRLLRKTFAEALDDIEDGSVDLLHVDGRHFYEDVKTDFESWIPKLSNRAIVLFHDTEVLDRGFGVFRYWEELTKQFPTMNFTYQHGLGVLFYGMEFSDEIREFMRLLNNATDRESIHSFFSLAGQKFILENQIAAVEVGLSLIGSKQSTNDDTLDKPKEVRLLIDQMRAAISLHEETLEKRVTTLEGEVTRQVSENSHLTDQLLAKESRAAALETEVTRRLCCTNRLTAGSSPPPDRLILRLP